jgi:hypothetical protein
MDNGELIIENARGRVLGCLILSVIPAQAGIQDRFCGEFKNLDSRVRGNDGMISSLLVGAIFANFSP